MRTSAVSHVLRILKAASWAGCGLLALALALLWARSYFLCDTLERRWSSAWSESTDRTTPPSPAEHTINAGWYAYSVSGNLAIGRFSMDGITTPPPPTPQAQATNWSFNPGGRLVPIELLRNLQASVPDWTQTISFGGGELSTHWQKGYNRIGVVPFWALFVPLCLLALLPLPSWLRRRRARFGKGFPVVPAAAAPTAA